jgi:hypothetical protein
MQVVSFQVPRLYEDIPLQIGGTAQNPLSVEFWTPYSQEEKKLVEKTNTTYANETLMQFWGIDDNSPAPPTLNGTGRGSRFIAPHELPEIHAELSAVYGYPAWLHIKLADFLLYDMELKNQNFLQYPVPLLDDLTKKLSEFNEAIRKGIIVEKIIIDFQGSNFEDIFKSSLKYVRQETGYKTEKYYPLNQYFSSDQNLKRIEIPLENEIAYNSYFEFNFFGDKRVDFSDIYSMKIRNQRLIVSGLLELVVYASWYRLIDYDALVYPPDTCAITLHYKAKEVKVFFPQKKPKLTLTPEPEPTLTPEPEPEPQTQPIATKKTQGQKQEPFHWLWAVLLFVILLITLQKASQ